MKCWYLEKCRLMTRTLLFFLNPLIWVNDILKPIMFCNLSINFSIIFWMSSNYKRLLWNIKRMKNHILVEMNINSDHNPTFIIISHLSLPQRYFHRWYIPPILWGFRSIQPNHQQQPHPIVSSNRSNNILIVSLNHNHHLYLLTISDTFPSNSSLNSPSTGVTFLFWYCVYEPKWKNIKTVKISHF